MTFNHSHIRVSESNEAAYVCVELCFLPGRLDRPLNFTITSRKLGIMFISDAIYSLDVHTCNII